MDTVKTCRVCGEAKALQDFQKRSDARDGLRSECRDCCKKRFSANYFKKHDYLVQKARSRRVEKAVELREFDKERSKNPERKAAIAAAVRKHNELFPERVRELSRAYYAKHPEKQRAAEARCVAKNPEKARNAANARGRKHYAKEPFKSHARARKYQVSKITATPAWANTFFMEEAYALAKLRTAVTGIKWHVDHIVPVRSRLVCGLHCEANLQVITARQNLSKGNRIWPDMP